MKIVPQVWKTHNGQRPITYGIWKGNIFLGYTQCFCAAMKAIQMIAESIPSEKRGTNPELVGRR